MLKKAKMFSFARFLGRNSTWTCGRVTGQRPSDRSRLAHPDAPGERAGLLIGYWAAGGLEGQLDLTVMVSLVPEHLLEQEDRAVVMKVHVAACLNFVLYRVAHHLGAVVQHVRDTSRVTLDCPLFLRQVIG